MLYRESLHVHADMTLTGCKVKVKVTGVVNFRTLAKPCMHAGGNDLPVLYGFAVILVLERPFVKRFALCYRTVVLSVLSLQAICDVGDVLWPNG